VGSSNTVTQASSSPSPSSNKIAINEEAAHSPQHEHDAAFGNKDEKKSTLGAEHTQQQPTNAQLKEQTHDLKKDRSNQALADANQRTSPRTQDRAAVKTPDVTAPDVTNVKSSTVPSAPATPSTAQAAALGAGSATVDSGALSTGAGAQAQSGAQSTGPSQTSPAQAAASGSSVAGAGASSTAPTQSAAANGFSLASTGATLQKSP
jgi:hypothetical protein